MAGRIRPANPTSLAVAKRDAPPEVTHIRHGSCHDEDMSEIFRLGVAGANRRATSSAVSESSTPTTTVPSGT
jgi:hypothetical protein